VGESKLFMALGLGVNAGILLRNCDTSYSNRRAILINSQVKKQSMRLAISYCHDNHAAGNTDA